MATTKLDNANWRPIESAPRDGTTVVVWESLIREPFTAADYGQGWRPITEHLEVNAGWNGGVILRGFRDADITHWMPLPPPPENNDEG